MSIPHVYTSFLGIDYLSFVAICNFYQFIRRSVVSGEVIQGRVDKTQADVEVGCVVVLVVDVASPAAVVVFLSELSSICPIW
jgi:hypothetical protein